jgi:hypothetical protein
VLVSLVSVPFASIGTVIAVILFAAMVRGPVGVKRRCRDRGIFSRPEWLSPARRLPEADSAGGH